MTVSARSSLAILLTLAAGATPLGAQEIIPLPEAARPARPWTPHENDRRQALHHYAQALVCVREDRLVEQL